MAKTKLKSWTAYENILVLEYYERYGVRETLNILAANGYVRTRNSIIGRYRRLVNNELKEGNTAMGAIALPKKYTYNKNSRALCKRIGIRFNGIERPLDVDAYDVDEGWIKIRSGEVLHGLVEPFWR